MYDFSITFTLYTQPLEGELCQFLFFVIFRHNFYFCEGEFGDFLSIITVAHRTSLFSNLAAVVVHVLVIFACVIIIVIFII